VKPMTASSCFMGLFADREAARAAAAEREAD
jgi:hypothetical protein